MIGAWCFADHFGPTDGSTGAVMQVGLHPHIGLQTVTWLVEGDVTHRDSLGVEQWIRSGQLNLMTSGDGIAHAEESVPASPAAGAADALHGIQLWVALPDSARQGAPGFEHHAELPVDRAGGFHCTVLVGEALGARSPAQVYTPLLGVELVGAEDGGHASVPLDRTYEHGVVVLDGRLLVAGQPVEPGALAYLGYGRTELELAAEGSVRALLLGGEPFGEDILMWWNFVARSWEEIADARADWEAGASRFRTVTSELDRIPAPALHRPRPR